MRCLQNPEILSEGAFENGERVTPKRDQGWPDDFAGLLWSGTIERNVAMFGTNRRGRPEGQEVRLLLGWYHKIGHFEDLQFEFRQFNHD